MKKIKHIFLFFSILLLSIGCSESLDINKDQLQEDLASPIISSFEPASGEVGTIIKIKGEYLSNINSAKIGTQKVGVKNRISEEEIEILVTANAESGKIVLKNTKGEGESASPFSVTAIVPEISEIKTQQAGEMTVGDEVIVEGENLKAVKSVVINDMEASITFIGNSELKFIVPSAAVGQRFYVELVYKEAGKDKIVKSETDYLIVRPAGNPVVDNPPASALINSELTLSGTDLDLVDKVFLGDLEVSLTSKTATSLSFMIPTIYGEETAVDIKFLFSGDQEIIGISNFKIEVPIISNDVYFYGSMILGAEGTEAVEGVRHFIDPRNGGNYYTACNNYADIKANTFLYITSFSSGGTFQFNNPNNTDTQALRFKCNGTEVIPKEKLTNMVKFRVLSSSGAQNVYAEKVRNRTLGKISPEIVKGDGIGDPTTSTPRFGTNYKVGDVIMFGKYDSTGVTLESVGFMEVVTVVIDEADLAKSTMTVHCFFQK